MTTSVMLFYCYPGIGVAIHVCNVFGFWWGVLYGIGWPIWIGYRLASWLIP